MENVQRWTGDDIRWHVLVWKAVNTKRTINEHSIPAMYIKPLALTNPYITIIWNNITSRWHIYKGCIWKGFVWNAFKWRTIRRSLYNEILCYVRVCDVYVDEESEGQRDKVYHKNIWRDSELRLCRITADINFSLFLAFAIIRDCSTIENCCMIVSGHFINCSFVIFHKNIKIEHSTSCLLAWILMFV